MDYCLFILFNVLFGKCPYKIGSKISHKVTSDALIVFARNKIKQSLLEEYEEMKDEALATIKSEELIEFLDYERKKRSFILALYNMKLLKKLKCLK